MYLPLMDETSIEITIKCPKALYMCIKGMKAIVVEMIAISYVLACQATYMVRGCNSEDAPSRQRSPA